jgi:hypothetical protein
MKFSLKPEQVSQMASIIQKRETSRGSRGTVEDLIPFDYFKGENSK